MLLNSIRRSMLKACNLIDQLGGLTFQKHTNNPSLNVSMLVVAHEVYLSPKHGTGTDSIAAGFSIRSINETMRGYKYG